MFFDGFFRSVWLLVSMLLLVASAQGADYPLPPLEEALVGSLQRVEAHGEDTLLDIAYRHEVGQREILIANPGVDRWLPGEGTGILLPTRYVLPDTPREGIVLNVPEMRLYYYPTAKRGEPRVVVSYPVSIGRMDWQTPLGGTRIVTKTRNPSWRPPRSIKDAALAEGEPLPDVIPPGPNNPLGTRALRLGLPGYLIHGTNKPFGVGMRVTHGCVRMTPEAIEAFFDRVKVGTRVAIVNQAVKVGWSEGILFVEVHPPLDEHTEPTAAWFQRARELVDQAIGERRVAMDEELLTAELQAHSGVPVPIAFLLYDEPDPSETEAEVGSGVSLTPPQSDPDAATEPEWSIPPVRDELF